MPINQAFLAELTVEGENTRKMLSRVPFEHAIWKPHEKSMDILSLAKHVAEMWSWVGVTLTQDELDFAKPYPKPPEIKTNEELMDFLEKNLANAKEVLAKTSDEVMGTNWTMRTGEKIYFTMPKVVVLRSMVFNHIIHHRAQLGVYLRMLNVPLPGLYGPSADDMNM